MIMEIIPGYSDEINRMCEINLTIVEVKTMGSITEEFIMVDPYIPRFLNGDSVIAHNFVYHKVPDNYVGLAHNSQTTTIYDTGGADSNDGGIIA